MVSILQREELEFSSGQWGVRIQAPARLSFTLIDLNGSTGRRNGMASMSLKRPSVRATLWPSGGPEHHVCGKDTGHSEEISKMLAALRDKWEGPAVRCVVEDALPAHHGFGSKTTTLLAIGKAYAVLCSTAAGAEELAQLTGRAGTSGASVNLIEHGGFLIDGGHANPSDFSDDPHRYLLPSRFAGAARKPPPLVRLPFPPWPFLILVGKGTELHGKPELDWFRQTLPIPYEEVCRTAHLLLMNMAPAVAEADYPAFCRALNRLTFETYYKTEQIKTQSNAVKHLLGEGRAHPEIDAIGMSVTGPMCFALTRNPSAAARWAKGLERSGAIAEFYFTAAQNHPAEISVAVPGEGEEQQ
ncbi:beta-ribofuranosylaminobenzene 5'-phosphate synthase family protein [Streptomyces collinus]|uniref:beta-ribofuranosylaminobenzene 5'-phosphate synthase family protein n=1 Tax=Streptomyces collinus TaxID=42684 RepID=UPI0036A89543